MKKLILIALVSFSLFGCKMATKSQVDRVGDLTLEVVEENNSLVETHPRYQVTDDMDDEEKELTEQLKQAKLDRNKAIKDAVEALQAED